MTLGWYGRRNQPREKQLNIDLRPDNSNDNSNVNLKMEEYHGGHQLQNLP